MLNKWIATGVLLMGMVQSQAWAADSDGKFSVRSMGLATCSQYVEEKAKAEGKYAAFLGWMEGYLTATSQYAKDTYDVVPWGNAVYLGTMLAVHCKANPEQRFYVAVASLARAMQSNRIVSLSPVVEAKNGEHKTYLYKEVLERLQTWLKENKYYDGAIDGAYGNKMRDAIVKFQKTIGMDETGVPDQLLLHRALLQSKVEKAK